MAGSGGGRARLDLQADAVFGRPESRVGKRSETRLELDIKSMPLGVIPALRDAGKLKGLSLTAYCRTVLIEHALRMEGKDGDEAADPR